MIWARARPATKSSYAREHVPTDFYDALRPFTRFDEVVRDEHYARAPSDAVLLISDVEGSTRAIEDGRYKDVNALGVASILAARNAAGRELAYVFGGDGATILVPADLDEACSRAVAQVRAIGKETLGLSLRVGRVPVRVVEEQGAFVELARFEATEHARFAMFRGGGLVVAEKLVKDPELGARYAVPDVDSADPRVLDGFECRWNPLPSTHGVVLAVLVESLSGLETYERVLRKVAELAGGRSAPVQVANLSLATDPRAFRVEAALRGGSEGTVAHALHRAKARALTALGRWLLSSGRALAGFDGKTYAAEVAAQSDTKKFDDCLRMVLDVSEDEADAFESYLDDECARGVLVHGVHRADAALMTCMVKSHAGNHIHFVDAADGGYAFAAKQLKRRRKRA